MPLVGFEPKISVLERAKTVRALDHAATAIGRHKGRRRRRRKEKRRRKKNVEGANTYKIIYKL
jgi:hypothetical protein